MTVQEIYIECSNLDDDSLIVLKGRLDALVEARYRIKQKNKLNKLKCLQRISSQAKSKPETSW